MTENKYPEPNELLIRLGHWSGIMEASKLIKPDDWESLEECIYDAIDFYDNGSEDEYENDRISPARAKDLVNKDVFAIAGSLLLERFGVHR